MKRIWMPVLLLLCGALFTWPAAGYNALEDSLLQAPDSMAILEQEEQMLQTICGEDEALVTIHFDRALPVLYYDLEDYVSALESGLITSVTGHDWKVWYIPISGGDCGDEYLVATGKNHVLWENTAKDGGYGSMLLSPEGLLTQVEGERFDDLYITSIPVWGICMITLIEGEEVRLLVQADAPHLFELENGQWYTPEELYARLTAGMGTGGGPYSGGGGIGSKGWMKVALVSGGLLLLCGGILYFTRRKPAKE